MAILFAIEKWRHYLIGKHFKIEIVHQPLKHLMDQKITTLFQQMWLAKLMPFNYDISYKKGKENVVADALSKMCKPKLFTMSLSSLSTKLLDEIEAS